MDFQGYKVLSWQVHPFKQIFITRIATQRIHGGIDSDSAEVAVPLRERSLQLCKCLVFLAHCRVDKRHIIRSNVMCLT